MILDRAESRSLWAVVIAGARAPTQPRAASQRDGVAEVSPPSPFRRFVGTRSMLGHTIDRALQLVRSDHLITVIQADHRPYLEEAIGGLPPGLLLEQPRDCGSAVSVLFSLAHIPERDPEATVIVLPADQFVYPEERWVRIIAVALHLARRSDDRLVVLGAVPHDPEAHAEWTLAPSTPDLDPEGAAAAGGRNGGAGAARPGPGTTPGRNGWLGIESRASEGSLWITNIVAARARTLWRIGGQVLPDTVRSLGTLRQVVKRVRDGAAPSNHRTLAVAHVYSGLGRADLAHDLLYPARESVLPLAMDGVLWSDWSRSDRVAATLRVLHRPGSRVTADSRVARGGGPCTEPGAAAAAGLIGGPRGTRHQD